MQINQSLKFKKVIEEKVDKVYVEWKSYGNFFSQLNRKKAHNKK